jgi:hypothetical protein
MSEINHLNTLMYGHSNVAESFDERGPLNVEKVEAFDTGSTPTDPVGATLHKITWLERKTPTVNPADLRLQRELENIDTRFRQVYKTIDAGEAAEFKRETKPLAKNAPLKLFIPLTKLDEEKHLIYGVCTSETPDRDNEILDYQTSKPFFEEWSKSVERDSGGISKGNVREMHRLSACGRLEQIQFNDVAKRIEVAARIVDEGAWKKCKEGIYVGFSVGGKYRNTWKDGGLTRYTAEPVELSLVDRPCVPDATFQLVKADGSTETRKFTADEGLAAGLVSEILGLVNA